MSDPFDGLMGQQQPSPHQPPAAMGHRLEGARPAALSQAAQPSPRYHQYYQNQPHLQPRLHPQQMGSTGGDSAGQGYPQHGWNVNGIQYYASQQHHQQQQPSLVPTVGYPTSTALAQPAGQQVVPGVPWTGPSSSGVGFVPKPNAVGSEIGYRPPQQQQQQHLQFPPHSGIHLQRQNQTGWINSVRHQSGLSPSPFIHGQETTLTTSSAAAAVGGGPTAVSPIPGQQPMTSALSQSSVQDSTINTGAAVVSGGGAEWSPPGEQLMSYERMFAAASAGSLVPGSVSGRAAVQFFSRSGLPKDVLKTVSSCDVYVLVYCWCTQTDVVSSPSSSTSPPCLRCSPTSGISQQSRVLRVDQLGMGQPLVR